MKTARRFSVVFLVFIWICYLTLSDGAYLSQRNKRSSDEVSRVVDAFWEWRLSESPEFGTKYKLYTHENQVEEYTEQAMARKVHNASDILENVKAVDIGPLTSKDKITIEILKKLLETYIQGYDFRVYGAYNPLGTMYNPLNDFTDMVGRMKFETEGDYNNWLTRLSLLPKTFSDMTLLMDKAIQEKKTLNSNSLTGVVEKFDNLLKQSPTDMVFYKPFKNIPTGISGSARNSLQNQAQDLLRNNVIPAISNMRNYIADTYSKNTRPDIGASSLPGGEEFYQACLDWHLSTSMTPKQVHDKGLEEVERIKGEMEKIKKKAGYDGTLKEYIAELKADEQNFYQTGDEMLDGYRSLIAGIKAKVPTIFAENTEVEMRIEENPNKNGPLGRYSEPSADGNTPGVFKANVDDAQNKPKFDMMALTLHETYPGHHLQAGYALEQGLPYFRRLIEYRKYYAVPFNWPFFTAYIEGWGLYAEKLGEPEDMDMYRDDKELFGRYTSEIFRSSRLVIDTGIHAFGWTKQQAKDYLAEYTTLADSSIENEINRYITWPGQATAYKIGELKIVELRNKAENKLRDNFDLKEFHMVILDLGPAPLSVLEKVCDDWIEQKLQTSGGTHPIHQLSYLTLIITLLSTKLFISVE